MELTREEFDAARQMLIEVYIDGASSRFGVSSYKAVVSISEGANKALMHALDNFDEAIDIFKISLSEQGLRIIEHDSRSMVERLAEIMKPE
jgi:predicted P-loop ATPase/GTPase